MNFWPFKRSTTSSTDDQTETQNVEVVVPKYTYSTPTIGQRFHNFIHDNMPRDFEYKLDKTKPYIVASFIAWPMFWLYRGLEWKSHRHNSRLGMYIQKTYLQAKFMQFAIIMGGLAMASLTEDSRNTGGSGQIER